MRITSLPTRGAQILRGAAPTFDGALGVDTPAPEGFTRLQLSKVVGRGGIEGLAADLFTWRVHARAGLRVAASDVPAQAGTVVLLRLGISGASVSAPCRVVQVVQDPDRAGFAYVTLPGHPECGLEWFVLERAGDGAVRFTVTAISAPASRLARASGPLGAGLQHLMTRRYLDAFDHRPRFAAAARRGPWRCPRDST